MIIIRARKSRWSTALSSRMIAVCCVILVLPTISLAVTTTHYDKPPETKLYPSDIKIGKFQRRLANLTIAERQKRLLPYINFYLTQQVNQPYNEELYQDGQKYQLISPSKINYQPVHAKFSELIGTAYQPDKAYEEQQLLYHQKAKFTPFLESNALPGPFIPMAKTQPHKIKVNYVPLDQSEKIPNYSAIYDKLSQLKLQQSALDAQIGQQNENNGPQYILAKKPQINFIPAEEYQEQAGFAPGQHPETFVHTYSPTSIEVSPNIRYEPQEQLDQNEELPGEVVAQQAIRVTQMNNPKLSSELIGHEPIRITQINNPKQHNQGQIAILEEPIRLSPQQNYMALTKNPLTHYVVHEQKQYHNQNHKQYLQEIVPHNKPSLILIPQKTLVPQIQYTATPKQEQIKVTKPIIILQPTATQAKAFTLQPIVPQNYQPITTIQELPQQIATPEPDAQTENPNSLSQILKRLQDSNALPQTLTPENIDNSIKTLVHILSSFKKQQKLTASPIIVADEGANYEEHENEAGVGLGESHGEVPGTTVEFFPAHTPEGGTPGKPGVDYPALSSIPKTNFNCKTQRYKGFFADPDTHCQVWHYCDLNGGQASFLCPNGTIFSQVALTCDWWFNVKCSTTTQLYVLNERLYKYIIPLTPKFPEDYTGPLVDRYIALKFKEMEEKMKNEKKDKKPTTDKNDEIDELQLLEDGNNNPTQHPNSKPVEKDPK